MLHTEMILPSAQAWEVHLTLLVCCVQQVRQDLNGHLTRLNGDRDWSFILSQVGMFSFTGLNKVHPNLPESLFKSHLAGLDLAGRCKGPFTPSPAGMFSFTGLSRCTSCCPNFQAQLPPCWACPVAEGCKGALIVF